MTGKEAWSLISPILAAHMVQYTEGGKHDMDLLNEAHIMTFGAPFGARQERTGGKE